VIVHAWQPVQGFHEVRDRVGDLNLVLRGELLDAAPYAQEVRYVALDGCTRVAHLHLTLIERPGRLAAGTVLDVFTVVAYRRRGIAGRLWAMAVDAATAHGWPSPRHSPSRTVAGDRFAHRMSGPVPALYAGRHVDPHDIRLRDHLALDARPSSPTE
jgi:GNAT superfamily N-acetyltransferase